MGGLDFVHVISKEGSEKIRSGWGEERSKQLPLASMIDALEKRKREGLKRQYQHALS